MKSSNRLLIDESPLVLLPTLAKKIGLNEAIFLQQVHYWIKIFEKSKDERHFLDGRFWVWNTLSEWENAFPFWSMSTLRRVIKNLEDEKIVLSVKRDAVDWDQTKWYSIDYQRLEFIIASGGMNSEVEDVASDATDQAETEDAESDVIKNPSAARALKNHAKRREENNDVVDYGLFPEDVQETVRRFCDAFGILPPIVNGKSKGGEFQFWIRESRRLNQVMRGVGFAALNKAILELERDKKTNGKYPFVISHPGALVKIVSAKAGEIRKERASVVTDDERDEMRERVKAAKEKVGG